MRVLLSAIILAALIWATAMAKDVQTKLPPINSNARVHPVLAKGGMVAAQDRIAAQIGADILRRGGNAVDAAVATGFALAVSHPQAGNIGGGGFMMISLVGEGEVVALDFREMAPAAADRDMYLGPDGEVDNRRSQYSHLSAGVPGTVMGLLEALETYGTMTRRQVIGPAIRLAYEGFPISASLSASLAKHQDILFADPSSVAYFYKNDQSVPAPGYRLRQKDLAATLRRILKDGTDGFYGGKTAEFLLTEIKKGGGILAQEDLDNYQVFTRKAVTGQYKGYEIASMPPPSSGGVHIIQMLNILSGYDLKSDGHNSADYMHKLVEVMRLSLIHI